MVGPGRFITIEGGEGVGKSLFLEGLAKCLRERLGESRLVVTREPGGTPAANQIRALFGSPPVDDPLLMETEAFLVSAARAQHVGRLIRPTLARGGWVLCDRFADSTRVYQGRIGGLPEQVIETLIEMSTKSLEPEVTFLLDCDTSVSLSRLSGRRDDDSHAVKRYDDVKKAVHVRLRQAYLDLLDRFPVRLVRLDASLAPLAVVEQAMKELERRFASDLN